MEKLEEGEEAAAPAPSPATATTTAGTPPAGEAITIKVKFRDRTISVSLSPESTGMDLKSRLEPLTDILPRAQKLISKGEVLADSMSLKSLHISDGSKIMLIVSHGRQEYAPNLWINPFAHQDQPHNTFAKDRLERWKSSGTAALTEGRFKLQAIPDEVWDCGPSLRVLYISNSSIQELPAKIGSLKSLNKLHLHATDLSDEMVSWDGLSQLESLTILSFNQNKLTVLPPAVGDLISLTQLHISMNKLTCLPDELGRLNRLQILHADCNRISSVPESIGNCTSIIEIDLSANLLAKLPDTFENLRNLKVLYLSYNCLKSLPTNLFTMCTELSRLDLHRTEITEDFLYQLDGWEDFDLRRYKKHLGRLGCVPPSEFQRDDNQESLP